MITVTLGWNKERMATIIKVQQTNPYRYAAVLVNDVFPPKWWELRRRWANRLARRRYAVVMANTLECDFEVLDKALREILAARKVSLV